MSLVTKDIRDPRNYMDIQDQKYNMTVSVT